MFENEKHLSDGLRKKMEEFAKKTLLAEEFPAFLKIILRAYDEGMDDGVEDDSRCDDCDERRGGPMRNEGYD